MAELPRYRPLGARIGSMPSVDFVQTGRAAAAPFEAIDKALGQMADYLYQQEVSRAQAAGTRYGAENAPTSGQLETARKSGTGLAGILPGDDDTVFGQAATTSALAVVEARMETEARNAISQLRINADRDKISPDQFQVQLNGLIDGYSSSLSQIDPVSAVRFEASIATTANSNLLSYAKDAAEREEARLKIAVEYDLEENIIPEMQMSYQNGINSEGVTPDQNIDRLREKVAVNAVAVGDLNILEQFDKERDEARNGYFAEWASSNYILKEKQLKSGDITDPSVRSIWENMNDSQKQSALEAIRKAEDAELAQTAARRRQEEAEAKDRSEDLIGLIYDSVRSGDLDAARPLIEELESFDRDRAEKFNNILYTEGGIDRASVVQELDIKSLKGTLTIDDLLDAPAGSMTTATFNRFLGEIKANKDERHTKGVSLLSNYLGNPEALAFGRIGKPPENLKKLSDLKTTMTLRGLKEEDFDPIQFAEDYIANDQAKKTEDRVSKTASNSIVKKAKSLGIKTEDGKDFTTASSLDEIAQQAILFSMDKENADNIDEISLLLEQISEAQ